MEVMGATKWQAKAMSTLKHLSSIHWCHFHLRISHKVAKSKVKFISLSYGELQLTVCLSRGEGAF